VPVWRVVEAGRVIVVSVPERVLGESGVGSDCLVVVVGYEEVKKKRRAEGD